MTTLDRRTILATGALALAGAATQSGRAAAAGRSQTDLSGACDHDPDRRRDRRVSGPPHLLHRPQLRRACRDGSDPTREPPFFFQKPTDAIQNVAIGAVADHPYPSLTKNYHYEVELVAALKSGGTNIPRGTGAGPRLWLCASVST